MGASADGRSALTARPAGWSTTTERLRLDALTAADLEAVHALHADPLVWQHLPSGRHVDLSETANLVEEAVAGWQADGLGYWTVRLRHAVRGAPPVGTVIGVVGAARRRGPVWNVYYRLTPAAHGFGFAAEAVAAALRAAARVDPTIPVIAYLLEHNTASRRTAERAGLRLVWRGPDTGNPDPDATRLVFADRPVTTDVLAALTATPLTRDDADDELSAPLTPRRRSRRRA